MHNMFILGLLGITGAILFKMKWERKRAPVQNK